MFIAIVRACMAFSLSEMVSYFMARWRSSMSDSMLLWGPRW